MNTITSMLKRTGSSLAPIMAVLVSAHAAASEPSADLSKLVDYGKKIYARECSACHGVDGDGEGPGAYILSQKPRNLQLGVFKLRSTPSGQYPTDHDLFKSITNGLEGANGAMMPSFRSLSERDRWALVAAVKDIALIDEPGTAIELPAKPSTNIALGRDVYDRLQCASCHGDDGEGDGPSSLTLRDDQKRRTWAPDLTVGLHKGGGEPEDIYTRIVTGLEGSPMPSYAGKASSEELWALTDFVLSLGQQSQDNR